MNTLREAADWIEDHAAHWDGRGVSPEAIVRALRAALAAEQAQPMAVQTVTLFDGSQTPMVYTAPPREPVRLTDEQIDAAWDSIDMRHPRGDATRKAFARAVEAEVLKANGMEVPR